jgi:hypothetical protein
LSSNKRRWDVESWVPPGDIPAGPFGDLAPSPTSALSIWLIDQDLSNLDRIVAALAAGRNHLDKFDYVLVDERAVLQLQVEIEARAEKCPDEEASAQWHRNMIRLTGSQLNALVRLIYSSGLKRRILEPDVEAIIRSALQRGHLDRSRVNKELLASLAAT